LGLHIANFSRGMDRTETLLNIAGPFGHPVTIGLVAVAWRRSNVQLFDAPATICAIPDGTITA
jgi:hypothetical protein